MGEAKQPARVANLTVALLWIGVGVPLLVKLWKWAFL
jgi:hypothetical protein